MTTSSYLGGQSGVQYNGIETDDGGYPKFNLQNALLVGEFKRGPFHKPFKVTKETMEAQLSYDYANPYYIALEDAFKTGAEYVWVMRTINPLALIPPKDEQGLDAFDYAVIRYIWTNDDGVDLDTRTRITNPPRTTIVGWNKGTTDEGFLQWGSDNTGEGVESVLLDLKELRKTYPDQKIFEVSFRAFWYGLRHGGNFRLQVETYKNGTMRQDGFNFVNDGGSLVQSMLVDCYTPDDTTDREGFLVASLKYDTALKKGTLTKHSDAVNPPVRTLSLSTPGTLLFRGNPDDLSLANSNQDIVYSRSQTNEPLSLHDSSNRILF